MGVRQALIQDTQTQTLESQFWNQQNLPNVYLLRGKTTGSTATELFINGQSGVRIPVPNESVLGFTSTYVYMNVTDDEGGVALNAGCIENDGGTTALIGTVSSLINTAAADVAQINDGSATSTLAITADNTNDALIFTVTGTASKDIFHKIVVQVIPVVDPDDLNLYNRGTGL